MNKYRPHRLLAALIREGAVSQSMSLEQAEALIEEEVEAAVAVVKSTLSGCGSGSSEPPSS